MARRFCHTALVQAWNLQIGSFRQSKTPVGVQLVGSFPFKHRGASTSTAAVQKGKKSAGVPASPACVWVIPCPVRAAVEDQLRASCKMLLTETFSPFAITTTGSPHTQSFYRGVETTWGFPPTTRQGLEDYYFSEPRLHYSGPGFIMMARRARRGCAALLSAPLSYFMTHHLIINIQDVIC